MAAAGREASAVIAAAGIPVERIDVIYELDMHYLGQTHTVAVPLPVAADAQRRERERWCARRSRRRIRPRSAACCRGSAVRIVSLRVAAIGRRPAFDFSVFAPDASGSLDKAKTGSRKVWFAGGWRETSRLVAARAAGGRHDRRTGDPRAARCHHGDRAGPCRRASIASATSSWSRMSKADTALILGDLQNDFLHPDGAYGRAGQAEPAIAALPARLAPLRARCARQAACSSSRRCSRSCPDVAASRSSRRI